MYKESKTMKWAMVIFTENGFGGFNATFHPTREAARKDMRDMKCHGPKINPNARYKIFKVSSMSDGDLGRTDFFFPTR